jgi:pimeloyl-ACP methyl ester carboxylesterase
MNESRGHITVGGKRLEIAWVTGSHEIDRPVIVLLHEGLGSVSRWREVPEMLAAECGSTVMAYSRLGYGQSEPTTVPRPVSYLHEEAAALPKVLEAAGLSERPLVLFGHSDGASIALIYAADAQPKNILALVLEAPHVFVEDLAVESIAQSKTSFLTTDLPERLAKHHAHVEAAFWGWNRVWLDPEFRRFNIEAKLAALSLPILIIQGRDDQYGTLAQVQSIVERTRGRVETLIVPGAKHSPHRDRTDLVIARTRDFIRSLSPPQ